jgi:hypothetical protein
VSAGKGEQGRNEAENEYRTIPLIQSTLSNERAIIERGILLALHVASVPMLTD